MDDSKIKLENGEILICNDDREGSVVSVDGGYRRCKDGAWIKSDRNEVLEDDEDGFSDITVKSKSDLLACNAKRENKIAYVKELDQIFVCKDSEWSNIVKDSVKVDKDKDLEQADKDKDSVQVDIDKDSCDASDVKDGEESSSSDSSDKFLSSFAEFLSSSDASPDSSLDFSQSSSSIAVESSDSNESKSSSSVAVPVDENIYSVENLEVRGLCNSIKNGRIYFVNSENEYFICKDEIWISMGQTSSYKTVFDNTSRGSCSAKNNGEIFYVEEEEVFSGCMLGKWKTLSEDHFVPWDGRFVAVLPFDGGAWDDDNGWADHKSSSGRAGYYDFEILKTGRIQFEYEFWLSTGGYIGVVCGSGVKDEAKYGTQDTSPYRHGVQKSPVYNVSKGDLCSAWSGGIIGYNLRIDFSTSSTGSFKRLIAPDDIFVTTDKDVFDFILQTEE